MKLLRLAALMAVMAALPAVAFAQSTDTPAKTKHPAKVVTTTMTGVVKSVDDSSMVMTRSNAKGPEQTFQLNASTTRKGKLVPGEVVNVRVFPRQRPEGRDGRDSDEAAEVKARKVEG